MTTGLDRALEALAAARPQVVLTSSAERAAAVIREQVADGLLRSGARLPEEVMAAALGVSRNTIREALGQLVAERVVVRVPNRGVLVATPTADDVRDIYRARRVIEPGCLRMSAGSDASAYAALEGAARDGQAAVARGAGDEVATANQHFHRAVVALSSSARLDVEMARLLAEMRLVFQRAGPAQDFHTDYVHRNAEIAALLVAGDVPGAAAALESYLVDAEQHLLTVFY
jgi:DNA-binding GntR family transcriptional regulator